MVSAGQVIRFLTVRATEGLIVILLIMFMPNIPPFCKITDSIAVTPSKPFYGKLALNEKLNDVQIWHKGDFYGPEAFADYKGVLYTSLHTGEIVKLVGETVVPVVKFGKQCKGFFEEKICGRPLGMQFDKDGTLVVADAYYGIFRVDVRTGEKIQLVSPDVVIDGKNPKLPNAVAIASNGDIYWTDSSTEFYLEDGLFDLFADGSGRLIHYDIATKNNTVLIDNLLFANGVALAEDEEYVIVSETGRSCIWRYYISGPKKGAKDKFFDGLPGLPDNLKSDGRGGFFVPLITARDDYTPQPHQILGTFPLFRKLIARLMGLAELGLSIANQLYPNELSARGLHLIGDFSVMTFIVPRRVSILHLSKDGEVLDSFHGNNRKANCISEAHIFEDQLYLGSPFNDYIARIPLSKLGLSSFKKITEAPRTTTTTQPPPPPTTSAPKTTTTSAPKVTTPEPTKAPPTTTTTTPKPTTTTLKPTTTAAPTTKVSETKPAPKPTAAPKKETPKKEAPKAESQKSKTDSRKEKATQKDTSSQDKVPK